MIYKITVLTNRQRHRRRREQTKERIKIGEGIIARKYEEREATQFFGGRKRDLLERQKSDYFSNIDFRVSLGLFLELLLALLLYAKWIVNRCAIFLSKSLSR